MQGTYQKQQPGIIPTGLRQGWLFGAIMLGIYLLYLIVDRISGFPTRFLIGQGASNTVVLYGVAGVLMVIAAIVFLIGGILASGKTGLASSGWVAGNFGGLVYGIGSFLVYGIVLFGFLLPSVGIYQVDPGLYWTEATSSLSNQLVTIFLFGGVLMGNLAGVIGGLIGRGGGHRRLQFQGN
jgi:hypothetical protein